MRLCRYRAGCFGAVILAGWLVAANAQAADADARAAYNRGVDLYSRGDYNKAAEAFQQALNTEQRRIEAWTNYNLGNARFEQANAAATQQPAAGVTQLKEALLFFQRALEMDPVDQNAKYNYELTAQRLKELEQQKGQQEKQPEKQQENQQEKKQEKQPDSSQMNKGPSAEDKKEEAQKQPAGSPQEQKSTMPQPEKTNENQPERKGAAAQAGTQEEQQKMTPQEAQMLLDNFQREAEMPQQLLMPERQREEAPVGKDW